MDQTEYQRALDQLTGAAKLVSSGLSDAQRLYALQMLAFFQLRQGRLQEHDTRRTSNDDLFRQTAIAALTLAGRAEYLAAAALLDQARTLLQD